MTLDKFDYNKNYNFSGIFWFENEFDKRFSGTLKYTPEKGIQLFLVSVALDEKSYLLFIDFCAIQKMYGTIQYNGNSTNITLLDVMLGKKTNSFNESGASMILEGNARFLIADIHLKENKIKSLNLEYDDCFKSIFFCHTSPEEVAEVQPYIKKPIKLSNASISFDIFYTLFSLYCTDQLDDILCDTFYHKKNSPMNELKKNIAQFLDKHKDEIGIREKPRTVIKIKQRTSDIRRYSETENKWRSFFELIIDKPITIKNAYIEVEFISNTDRKYITQKAILFQQYPLPTHRGTNWHKYHLPITIDSFSGEKNLLRLQEPYKKWHQLYDDEKWEIIIYGIKSIIYNDKLIGNKDFVILFSYIETVLDILGYKENNLDQLIFKYADDKWKDEVNNLLKNLPNKDSLGKKITELRNAIAHPKSAEKEKGKYFAIITNETLMQKIYGYLAGLFIKMILLHLYKFDENCLEKYIDNFIKSRSNITKVKYSENYLSYKIKLKNAINKKRKTNTFLE